MLQANSLSVIVVIFLLLVGIFTMKAQELGIKSGLNLSTVSELGGFNLKPGIQLGGYGIFGAREDLYFKLETNISQKGGWNWESNNPNNINLTYIDFPAMFCIETFGQLRLNLGIQPSMRIGGTYRSIFEAVEDKMSIGRSARRFDYATIVGVEYQINEKVHIGLRYNRSFIPILKRDAELEFVGNSLNSSRLRVVNLYVAKALKMSND